METNNIKIPTKNRSGFMKISYVQLLSIINMADNISSTIGGMDWEVNNEYKADVKNVDKFLEVNGLKRIFK